MRRSKIISYRRAQISRMLVLGMSQENMSKQLGVSQPVISRDIAFLDTAAAEQLKMHVQKKLPHIHLICARGIDDVIKTAWGIVASAKNDYVKIHALNLIHAAYITKQNLSTDGTVINNALELINKTKDDLKELQHEDGDELAFTNISKSQNEEKESCQEFTI